MKWFLGFILGGTVGVLLTGSVHFYWHDWQFYAVIIPYAVVLAAFSSLD